MTLRFHLSIILPLLHVANATPDICEGDMAESASLVQVKLNTNTLMAGNSNRSTSWTACSGDCEALCPTRSDNLRNSLSCIQQCYYKCTPVEIKVDVQNCKSQCLHDYYDFLDSGTNSARRGCLNSCLPTAMSRYNAYELSETQLSWQQDWMACQTDFEYTPPGATSVPGCLHQTEAALNANPGLRNCWPNGFSTRCGFPDHDVACCAGPSRNFQDRVACDDAANSDDLAQHRCIAMYTFDAGFRRDRSPCSRSCYDQLPDTVKSYLAECRDECGTLASDDTFSTADRHIYTCQQTCPAVVAQRIRALEELQRQTSNSDNEDDHGTNGTDGSDGNGGNGGGGGGGEGVSDAQLSQLALMIQNVEDRLTATMNEHMGGVRRALLGLMQSQQMSEERTRQSGGSGLTQGRAWNSGTEPYHTGTFTTPAIASIHNHDNGARTMGMGEFAAVMNGVSFRTRHNDYTLQMPSTTSSAYHAVENVPAPPVPPSVLDAGDINAQILEMREYFKAFKEQDISHRDYRPYFKPNLCYLETSWDKMVSDDFVEPFHSDRHHVAVTGWADLYEKARFYDMTGNKDFRENIPSLPMTVMGMEDGQMEPLLARWNYRILCHPVDGDVETVRLRLVQDSQMLLQRQTRFTNEEEVFHSRAARFRVDPRLDICHIRDDPRGEVIMGRNYLDLLMEQVPGKNNYAADFHDELMNPTTTRLETTAPSVDESQRQTTINKQHEDGPLNSGYYSRVFSGDRDAMGRFGFRRGFNDPSFWAAMTDHEEIANFSMTKSPHNIRPGDSCMLDGAPCPRINQRWTYAFPLEIVYQTPLASWNPHNLNTVHRHDVTGSGTEVDPYNGAAEIGYFYRTPEQFYGSCTADIEDLDSADTTGHAVYVQGAEASVKAVHASGNPIISKCIPGVGKVRMRYPIMPLHEEGSASWKEVKALEKLIRERVIPQTAQEPPPESMSVILQLRGGTADHQHEVVLTSADLLTLGRGEDVWMDSNQIESHSHSVKISMSAPPDVSDGVAMYGFDECRTSGGPSMLHQCSDGHSALAEISEGF